MSIFSVFAPKKPKEEKVKNYVDITIVLDRSASMLSMKKAVIDGLNEEFAKARKSCGKTVYSLYQFDDPDSAKGAREELPNVVFQNVSETELPELTLDSYRPRGATALVDAVCKSMLQVDIRTSGQPVGKKIMMIVTDGEENSSKEYTTVQMREMMAERNFETVYLGANQEAWKVAQKYDIAKQVTPDSAIRTCGGVTSWLHEDRGGALLAAPSYDGMSAANYTGASVLSGAVSSGAVNSFNFSCSYDGFKQALGSGLTYARHVASGHYFEDALKSEGKV